MTLTLPVNIHTAHLPAVVTALGQMSPMDSDAAGGQFFVGYDGSTATTVGVYAQGGGSPGGFPSPELGNHNFNTDSYFSVHFTYPIA